MSNKQPLDISEQVLKEIEKAHPNETLPAIIPTDTMAFKLKPIHKVAVAKWYAAGFTTSDIQKKLYDLAMVAVKQSTIANIKTVYRKKITELRQDIFGDDFVHIPIAQKSVRLARYEAIYNRLIARGQLTDAKKVLEDVRIELEGKEPLIRTGDILHNPQTMIGSQLNVSFTKDELKQVDGVILEALERENKGESSALVGQASND